MAQKEVNINTKPKPTLKFQRERDKEKVRGQFRCHEIPGGHISFVYRAYKGDPIEKYTLYDNQICEIPLGVARHINKNMRYPVHKYSIDKDGIQLPTVGQMKPRCSFQSLEFMDIEELRDMGDQSAQIAL